MQETFGFYSFETGSCDSFLGLCPVGIASFYCGIKEIFLPSTNKDRSCYGVTGMNKRNDNNKNERCILNRNPKLLVDLEHKNECIELTR